MEVENEAIESQVSYVRKDISIINGNFVKGDVNDLDSKILFTTIKDRDKYSNNLETTYNEPILDALSNCNIVIVSGGQTIDKSSFIRYIAILLQRKYPENRIDTINSQVQLEGVNIISKLIEAKENAIFVIDKIAPTNLPVKSLPNVVSNGDKWVIASTEVSKEIWEDRIGELPEEYWINLDEKDIYRKPDLINVLINKLQKLGPSNYFNKVLGITERLKCFFYTPIQIELFCDKLATSGNLNDDELSTLVEKYIRFEEPDFLTATLNRLTEKEKLMTISFLVFDNLYKDHFFELFKKLVGFSWKNKRRDLEVIDDFDLKNLEDIFIYNNGEDIFNFKFPQEKQRILQRVWDKYQGQILRVLPLIPSIIMKAAKQYEDNPPYESYDKRIRLNNTIADLLSKLGLISFKDVEFLYFELISTNDIARIIVAKSIALWRVENEDKFFEIIVKWQNDRKFLKEMFFFLHDQSPLTTVYFDATLALIVGYASLYDKPNSLNTIVLDLFNDLLRKDNRTVGLSLEKITIPFVISNHLKQIEVDLFDIATEGRFIRAIKNGLINTYNQNQSLALDIINTWRNKIIDKKYNNIEKTRIYIIVSEFLGNINYTNKSEISLITSFEILENLRGKARNKYLRRSLLDSLLNLIEIDISIVDSYEIPNIDKKERDYIVERFKKKYLEQRSEIEVNQEGERPDVKVEELLSLWRKHPNNVLKQIAGWAEVEFGKIELEEKRIAEETKEDKKERERKEILKKESLELEDVNFLISSSEIRPKPASLIYLFFAKIMLTTDQFKIFEGIVPILMQGLDENGRNVLIDRYKSKDDEDTQQVAKFIESRLPLFNTVVNNLSYLSIFLLILFILRAFKKIGDTL